MKFNINEFIKILCDKNNKNKIVKNMPCAWYHNNIDLISVQFLILNLTFY